MAGTTSMIRAMGEAGLWGAAIAAAGTLLACGAARARGGIVRSGGLRWGMVGVATGMALAAGSLVVGLVRGQFEFAYVAAHADRSLSTGLRIASLWSGEEGSLLVWALLLGVAGAIAGFSGRSDGRGGNRVMIGVPAAVSLFFCGLLLLRADPFALSLPAPADGHGLHPELRHWAMLMHPPMLLLGSAASIVPFAMACGALAGGRSDGEWVVRARRWIIGAWLCVGMGLVLGAAWAYTQLGWGGYWGWDPVENVALLPWLTGTALVHAVIVHQHRGVMKGWAAGLASATFLLSLWGASITRSTLVQSVHGFGGSGTGLAFGVFAALLTIGTVVLLIWRRRLLAPRARIESLASREGASLLGGVMLSVMATTVLVGTLLPLFTRLLTGASVKVAPTFYVRTIAPLGIALVAVMSVSPILVYGRGAPAVSSKVAGRLAAGATGVALLGLVAGLRSPTVVLCLAILGMTVLCAGTELVRTVATFARHGGYGFVEAAARVIDGNHRRYGGQLAHAGAAVLVIGLVGSSLLTSKTVATIAPGETFVSGTRTLRLDGLREFREPDCTVVEASVIEVTEGLAGATLRPQRRLYDEFGHAAPRAAVASGWREDLYLSLAGWEAGGSEATLEARINPFMIWVWIGAGIVGVAGLLCLLPRLMPRHESGEFIGLCGSTEAGSGGALGRLKSEALRDP